MEEESLKALLILRPARVVIPPEDPAVQPVRLMDLIGDMIGDGDQPQKVVMVMVLVLVRHRMEKERGPDLGLVQGLVQELGLGLAQEEEEPQAVVLAMEVGLDTQVKGVDQAVEMVELLQVVERGANTAKIISISCSS
ncbi:hypothetical protein BRARA_H00947 [Brassica rapa]|uniref:Uncharacterized protein n=1 Tax=Brassica campestris TaxID=3711 RepID=M4DWW9_BRACM|nr:uncharacterized protein LOC106360865 [Brassica napus]XP_018508965.1 uncharacterized protein LOC103834054 [Brassica rapa]RID50202.1 hypothetical protein BRARA_H00947 [Brassica rapa]